MYYAIIKDLPMDVYDSTWKNQTPKENELPQVSMTVIFGYITINIVL
jgi:hypothetical protein